MIRLVRHKVHDPSLWKENPPLCITESPIQRFSDIKGRWMLVILGELISYRTQVYHPMSLHKPS